ncbi:hypothetical protein DTO027B5_713 [Paecilomyces variotii]|nr:hypothetical protein DTO169C6_503 [Paecilomyces variotii]KAJ9290085.1 hypothetical protein DTO021C3_2443 [Paecilomyces variotii]KAJ9329523.1 hypothetical protein DTO027B3_10 [Paecilomyces variotii]KAJ9337364.1 hypothetical protein DTO027B5_713 [Paecilomyces variotii]
MLLQNLCFPYRVTFPAAELSIQSGIDRERVDQLPSVENEKRCDATNTDMPGTTCLLSTDRVQMHIIVIARPMHNSSLVRFIGVGSRLMGCPSGRQNVVSIYINHNPRNRLMYARKYFPWDLLVILMLVASVVS